MTPRNDDSFQGSSGAEWGTPLPTIPGDLPNDPGESYLTEATPPTAPDGTQFSAPPTELPTWLTKIEGGRPAGDYGERPAPRQVAFKLVRRVGIGGCGEVWEAVQESLGRMIAVKRLREDVIADDGGQTGYSKALEMEFRQEALTTARLEHPNIVPVHDFGQDEDGRPLLAMKLVKGKPWSDLLRADEELPVPEFLGRHLPILIDVAQAISFAHSKGIIHRDLKPSQVMVGRFGEVMLMDWGLAVKCLNIDDASAGDTTSFPTGFASNLQTARNPAGTPAYMAPEQTVETAKDLGTWTDIFLLGGILYRILTLSPPYNAPTAEECFAMARLGEVQPARKRAGDREVPKQLAQLATACLQAHPSDRLRNAQEFIEGLQAYMSGAGKRQEAEKTIAQVEEMLHSASRDYRLLARAHHLLERARALWPESRQVVELRDRVLREYANLAMDSGDLMLARLQAEQLRSEEERLPVLEEIGRREERIRRHARQRRQLVAVAVAAIAVLGGVLWFGGAERRRKADELAEQNALLVRQRNTGWDMMEFMLHDMQHDLSSAGRLDLVESMASKSVEYFDRLPPEQVSGGVMRQKSLAWRNLGDARLARGDMQGALEAHRQARQTAAQLLADQPDNGNYLTELADRRTRLGLAWLASGDLENAREEIDGAASVRRSRLMGQVDDLNLTVDVCDSLMAQARLETASGNPEAAAQRAIEARDLLASVAAKRTDDPGAAVEAARARLVAVEAQIAVGSLDGARSDATEASSALAAAAAANSDDVVLRRDLVRAHRLIAEIQIAQGRLVPASTSLVEARRVLDPVALRLPDDAAVLLELARVARADAEVQWRLGRFEKARPALAEAIAHCDRALGRAADARLAVERAEIAAALGDLEFRAGQPDAAAEAWRAARAALAAAPKSSAAEAGRERVLALAAARLAMVLASQGDCEEAAALASETAVSADRIASARAGAALLFAEARARAAAALGLCAADEREAERRWKEALEAVAAVPADRRGDTLRAVEALTLLKSGRVEEGVAIADGLLDRHADDPILDAARRAPASPSGGG